MQRHPTGLWVLFTTELWERFAFYTMRAILVLYLVSISSGDTPGFGWTEADAYKLYAWYTGLVYLAPLLGGWIADRFIGQRMCVIIGAILMALGEFCLAATEFVRIGSTDVGLETDPAALWTFYAGLGLMILGNGFFKPCISVMVGQLYAPGDRKRDAGFTIFYMGINIGAFMSPLIGGTVAEIYGYQWGFIIAGIGMILGLFFFLAWGKHLKGIGGPPPKAATQTATQLLAREEMTPEEKEKRERDVYEQTRPLDKKDYDKMFVIVALSILVIAFWTAFEQAGSSLNVFALRSTNRDVPSHLSERLFLKNEDFLEYRGLVNKIQAFADRIGREDEVIERPGVAERLGRFNVFRVGDGQARDGGEERLTLEEEIKKTRENASKLRSTLRSSQNEEVQATIDSLLREIEAIDAVIFDVLIGRLDYMLRQGTVQGDANLAEQVVAQIDELKRTVHDIADKTHAAERIREVIRRSPALTRVFDVVTGGQAEGPDGVVDFAGIVAEAQFIAQRTRILNEIAELVVDEQGRYGRQIQGLLLKMEEAERIFEARLVRREDGTVVEPLTFPASWFQSANPLFVIIFAPLFVLFWSFI